MSYEKVIGACKGGGVQGFWIQISNGPRILDSNFKTTRYSIQNLNWTIFWVQIFLYVWDSYLKPLFWDSFFKHAGILDSKLKLMGFGIQIWTYRTLLRVIFENYPLIRVPLNLVFLPNKMVSFRSLANTLHMIRWD